MLIEERARIRERRQLVVRLSTAPDGLPLVLAIDRGTPPETLLTPVARAIGNEQQPGEWTGRLASLAEEVRGIVDDRQFLEASVPDDEAGQWYLTWSNVRELCGPTLTERLLGVVANPAPWVPPDDVGTKMLDTRAVLVSEEQEEKIREREELSGTKLAIELESDRLGLARVSRQSKEDPRLERAWLAESAVDIPGAMFEARAAGQIMMSGAFGEAYTEARRQLESRDCSWVLVVPGRELLRLAVTLTRALARHHESGLVHADLKPANMLIRDNAVLPIDSLRVPIDEVSPGLSHDYAAPEQILGETVTPRTDQYAFGVLLTNFVDGLLYGQEVQFRIPVGVRRLEQFTLLKDPGVYIPNLGDDGPGREGLTSLKAIIRQCLAFKPEERHESMNALGDKLEGWLGKYELGMTRECDLSFGSLMPAEELGSVWVAHDVHP